LESSPKHVTVVLLGSDVVVQPFLPADVANSSAQHGSATADAATYGSTTNDVRHCLRREDNACVERLLEAASGESPRTAEPVRPAKQERKNL
jgi:hypothetical protein